MPLTYFLFMNCSPFQSPEFLYITVVFVWFSGVAQAEKGALDPSEPKITLILMSEVCKYAYGVYSFILNFVWVFGAASLVYVVNAPAAGEFGEPNSRFEGQYLLTGHYICPAAHANFINSSYYAADPSAFEFTAGSGKGSFDYLYVLANIIGYFCGCCCFGASTVASASKGGAGRTMR